MFTFAFLLVYICQTFKTNKMPDQENENTEETNTEMPTEEVPETPTETPIDEESETTID